MGEEIAWPPSLVSAPPPFGKLPENPMNLLQKTGYMVPNANEYEW